MVDLTFEATCVLDPADSIHVERFLGGAGWAVAIRDGGRTHMVVLSNAEASALSNVSLSVVRGVDPVLLYETADRRVVLEAEPEEGIDEFSFHVTDGGVRGIVVLHQNTLQRLLDVLGGGEWWT